MDRAGVDVGMVQGSDIRRTTYHPDFPDQRNLFVPNDYTAQEVARFPDRLIGVANIDPLRDVRAGVIEQRRCVDELGFRSSKFLPTYQNYYIDDPAVAPMLESCMDLDIVAHVNTGYSPIITAALRYGHPERLDRIGIRYRDLRVLAYVNFPYVDEGIAVVARHPNFYADIAYFVGAGPVPLFDALDKLRGLDALDRVVYGSDNNDKDRTGGGQRIGTHLLDELNEVAERTTGSLSSLCRSRASWAATPGAFTSWAEPMPTVDMLLYLTETPRHAPVWWMEELYRPYGGEYRWTDGAALVDLLDQAGIEVGLAHGSDIRRTTFHPSFPDEHEVYVPNDYTAAQCAAHPGRLYGVACVDPLREVHEAAEEIDRCVREYGFRMMKLLPTYHHHDPGDPRLAPVYEKCLELDIPIHTHTGFTPIINAPMHHARPGRTHHRLLRACRSARADRHPQPSVPRLGPRARGRHAAVDLADRTSCGPSRSPSTWRKDRSERSWERWRRSRPAPRPWSTTTTRRPTSTPPWRSPASSHEVGLRGAVARGITGEATDIARRYNLAGELFSYINDEEMEITRTAMEEYPAGGRVEVWPAPLNIIYNDQDLVRRSVALAREGGVGWHTHCSERLEDPPTYLEEYGIRPVEWLYQEGLLGAEATIAHGIYLDDAEIDHIGETGTGVAYCPISHQYIALGVMRLRDLRASGAPIGLGTDGPCCNHRQDMFEVMKQAILLQRVHTLEPTISNGEEALEMATREGTRYANIEAGVIAPGKLADIIVVNMRSPHLTPWHRTVSALTYCARGSDVVHSIIDGRMVLENGRCTMVDEDEVMREAQARSEDLIDRAGLHGLLPPGGGRPRRRDG